MKKQVIFAIAALLITLTGSVPHRAKAEPNLVSAVGNQLIRPNGTSVFLLGINYVGGPDRSWTMWQDKLFDPALIEQDFLRAKSAAVNTVRLFVRFPLNEELSIGRWGKLDTVVGLAEKYGLGLIITFYDYREDDLAKAAALSGVIAKRYAGRSAILAYDLKNEPQYQDLAIARYPGQLPPLQTDALVKHYGERMNSEEMVTWRQSGEGKNLIPARFSSRDTYIYANNYRIYLEFLKEAGNWVAARDYEVSLLDYIDSPDSAKWKPLLEVLDQTLAAWLTPQLEAVRKADPARLITVGYSNAVLAKLAANNELGFMSIHRFPNVGLKALRATFDLVDDLRRTFPNKPVVFEEFGYSNENADQSSTAQYETAMFLYLISQGMAGGAKWSLYDVAHGWNPREQNFGLYDVNGSGKPMATAMRALGEYVDTSVLPAGNLNLDASPGGGGMRYVYSAPDSLFVAAPTYADPVGRLNFEASGPAQVFVSWARGNVVSIISTTSANLHLNPRALMGMESVGDFTLESEDGKPVAFQRRGDLVTFAVEAGQVYRLRLTSLGVDARIQIVWPENNQPVNEAERANVGAYLFQQGMIAAVCPDLAPTVRLWRSLNNGVEEQVGTGKRRSVNSNGLAFSAWDFNGVDVAATRDALNKYYFRLSVDGHPNRSSIWSHGSDARTYLPEPDIPTGIATDVPKEVDAKIQIVWPHGNLPVHEATTVNIGAYLFQQGTLQSVPADWSPTVRLWQAQNNGYEEPVAAGRKVIEKTEQLSFPVWEFNNIDVSAAKEPLNKYYFGVTIDGVNSHSNVWSHGADARTYFPQKDTPTGIGACK